MNMTWNGSPNYWAGRTQPVGRIVLHWMAGSLTGTDATFQANVGTERATSAHYGIEDENVHQYVRDEDTAWHARQANPFTIGIEHSAQPGRAASDETYQSSIALVAALCKKHSIGAVLDPHSRYVVTTCPGSLDIDRIKQGVARLLTSGVITASTVAPDKPSLPQPQANKGTGGSLHLPAVPSWRIYNVRGPWTIGNQVGTLKPDLDPNGLTYEILGNPTANVYEIQTRDFGRVAIYAGAETGATVAATNQGITMGSGSSKTVYLPSAPTWRAYNPDGPYTIGNEVGYLTPSRWGGLAYAVLSQPVANVVVVQTSSYGRVALYVGSETGAQIK